MKPGLGLYRHMLTREYYDFARQAGCTHLVVHLVDYFRQSASNPRDNQPTGGSFKIISDTEDWDNSVGLNNPGQSGDVRSPHYRDLFEYWARGKYFPIFFSRPKVESVAEQTLTLKPQ